MTDLTMPRLSDSMEEGTILRWLAQTGQAVSDGEELLEVETDKATMTCPATGDGVLEILVQEGATVPVGTVIGRLGTGIPAEERRERPDANAAESQIANAAESQIASHAPTAAVSGGQAATQNGAESLPVNRAESSRPNLADDQIVPPSTPLARRIAAAHGIQISMVTGTGPRGRITKPDVLAAAGLAPSASTTKPTVLAQRPVSAPTPQRSPTDLPAGEAYLLEGAGFQPFTVQQRLIAKRMSEVKSTVPEFEVMIEACLDAALALRASLKQLADEESVPSINDFVVRACALALRRHPRVNASHVDGGIVTHSNVNIGIAVSTDDGLLVPVVVDADRKSLGTIARDSRALAERARSGEITAQEMEGGTFTVSNLGMFGVSTMTPVLNVGEAAILGVGATRSVLQRVDGEIVETHVSSLTLTCDHRVIYGAHAARFLADLKDLLEAPLRLAL